MKAKPYAGMEHNPDMGELNIWQEYEGQREAYC